MKLVFDVAGVLLHWDPLAMLMRLLPEHASDRAAAADWSQRLFEGWAGDWREFDRGVLHEPELVPRIAARTGLAPQRVQAVVEAIPHELQPLQGTVALVRRLKEAGQPVFYLSNMPASYSRLLEQRHDFFAWFDDGVFSGRVQAVKPEPAIFALAAQRFGLPPQEMVFFDDVQANVDAAREMGWNALLFTSAAQAEADLRQRGWWPL